MPRENELGVVRRSQVVQTYGPGALVDFRAGGGGGAPVSIVSAGLDVWDERAKPAGLGNPQAIHEPRLERQLGVDGFRLPPVVPEVMRKRDTAAPHLIGVRFPRWLQCPRCFRLKHEAKWQAKQPGDPTRTCTHHGDERVYVVPVGFVVSCVSGHLEEFPWEGWLGGHDEDCTGSDLRLQNEGASGLAGLILHCGGCTARRSMEGCTGKKALAGRECQGLRPWLPGDGKQACATADTIRVLQRGASNLYFAATASALAIPPWSDRIQNDLGKYWHGLVKAPPELRPEMVKAFSIPETLEMSAEKVVALINERIAVIESGERNDPELLKWEEYRQFTGAEPHKGGESREFEIEDLSVPPALVRFVARIVEAKRLREVRAIRGFTRIDPPGAADDPEQEARICALSLEKKNWLPAIEVKGEGLFIELARAELDAWVKRSPAIRERAARICRATGEPEGTVTPEFLLLHAFAHGLIRHLSVSSGYGSSALRERLYCGSAPHEMCGVLIYTATSDAEGTLGGLSRQARSPAIEETIRGVIASARWCASDPLCLHANRRLLDAHNAAACHACMFVAETSCECFNRRLDRATLVGTPADPAQGFFDALDGERAVSDAGAG